MGACAAVPAGTLLLVDDDEDVRAALSEILGDRGFRVLEAPNGREALGLLRAGGARAAPDAILFDLMMPVMDGWQFRLEQRRDPRFSLVPAVALSADHSARAHAVDADAFLEKPVEAKTLIRTVEDLIKAGRARRQEAERMAQTERLTSLGQLSAAVAHEISNPLTWVIGNLEIVSDRLAQPASVLDRLEDTRAAVREALEGAKRIEGIVSDIRVFTRKAEEEPAVVDLGEAVEAALRLLGRKVEGRARVVRTFTPGLKVRTSAGRLRQVLVNLLVNAVDALSPETPEDNEVRIILSPGRGGRARIEVADNGCGIPQSISGRVFEPFFSTKAPGEGTGLGLFVSQTLVQAMGGELNVESEVGRGTRFWFSLPRALEPEQVLPEERSPEVEPAVLLVADGEPQVVKALGRQFSHHTVLGAGSGAEALALLRERPDVDLVLVDLHLPPPRGRDFLQEVEAQDAMLAERTVFMTGGIGDEDTLDFAKSRADRVVQKPVDSVELEALIRRLRPRKVALSA